jgi:DNA-binding transcriptional MerR regulator
MAAVGLAPGATCRPSSLSHLAAAHRGQESRFDVSEHMQIGEVAERTGLSLRTIRRYEEVGLVTPATRSQGGFRLYTAADLRRLGLIRQMKALGFRLDEMRDLLSLLTPDMADSAAGKRVEEQRFDSLRDFSRTADHRCSELRARLDAARDFQAALHERRARLAVGASRGNTPR